MEIIVNEIVQAKRPRPLELRAIAILFETDGRECGGDRLEFLDNASYSGQSQVNSTSVIRRSSRISKLCLNGPPTFCSGQ
jgi:hypothetical protein